VVGIYGEGCGQQTEESVGAAATPTVDNPFPVNFTPTGTVTYYFFAEGNCDSEPVWNDQVDVSQGNVPDSEATDALPAGNYSFDAYYGGDSNYTSETSDCEPFTVLPAPTATTTIVNDATSNAAWTGNETVGATAYDTSMVTGGIEGFTPTGTVTYTFFSSLNCTGTGTSQAPLALKSDGTVPNSATTDPLPAGNYSFDAIYSGDPNYLPSLVSSCEPFSVAQDPTDPVISTTVFDATSNAALTNGNESSGGSVYDTATLTGTVADIVPTGTVTYTFFTNGNCTAPGTPGTALPLTSGGSPPGSAATGALTPGSYSFNAVYSGDSNYKPSLVGACEPFTVSAPATAPVVVTPAAPKTSPAVAVIAFTGADLSEMFAAAMAMMGAGALLVLSARRRRQRRAEG
jgi:hypothetical protein